MTWLVPTSSPYVWETVVFSNSYLSALIGPIMSLSKRKTFVARLNANSERLDRQLPR
jgi:hypothetical protein